jgi:hypothetical protein
MEITFAQEESGAWLFEEVYKLFAQIVLYYPFEHSCCLLSKSVFNTPVEICLSTSKNA